MPPRQLYTTQSARSQSRALPARHPARLTHSRRAAAYAFGWSLSVISSCRPQRGDAFGARLPVRCVRRSVGPPVPLVGCGERRKMGGILRRLVLVGGLVLTLAALAAGPVLADGPGASGESELVDVSHQLGDLGKKLAQLQSQGRLARPGKPAPSPDSGFGEPAPLLPH